AGVEESRVALYREQARAETTRRLHALAERTGLRPAQWQACVVEGDPSFRLVEKEQEFDCDLIAVGKHGTSMAVDLLLGSVTHHVLAEGSADVLISSARSDR
ncbi:MAG TPA: universal stress protein, partial [Burkholderiaceae bacterium]|nr:universal stress protein [Burkholderiaceae bacterium]